MLCFADNVEQKWGTKIHFVLNAASTSRMEQLRNKRKKNMLIRECIANLHILILILCILQVECRRRKYMALAR